MAKSVRELELIIMRLKSQLEAKDEQIKGMDKYIREATADTQKIITRFRAFCAKILENELAYSNITAKELQTMPLEELLDRSQAAHKQNQQKSREIYEMMKKKLMDKNAVIAGLTDQVTQLKVMLDNAADIFSGKAPADPDNDRTAAYLVDTDSSVEDVRPALAETEALESGEKIVDMTTNMTREVEMVSKSKTVTGRQQDYKVIDLEEIKKVLTDLMWTYIFVLGEKGLNEYPEIKSEIVALSERKVSDTAVYNAHNSLLSSGIISAKKIRTGSRWFLGVELTQLGIQIYIDKYGKAPVETEMKALITSP